MFHDTDALSSVVVFVAHFVYYFLFIPKQTGKKKKQKKNWDMPAC